MSLLRTSLVVAAWLLAGALHAAAADKPSPAEPPPPPIDQVLGTVTNYFAAQRNHQPGDLISQADWDALVKLFTKKGWTLKDAASIRASLLPEKSFLVRQSRRSEGRDFLRRVQRLPQGYDRLDHLSQLSTGEATITRLIDGPDGDKLIEYMTTSEGGAELGAMLSQAPGGKNFNRPTGRIYTAGELQQRISQSLEAERAAAARQEAAKRSAAKPVGKTSAKRSPNRP